MSLHRVCCCGVAENCPCDTGLSSAVATWTGSVTLGTADCPACTGQQSDYYTLDGGLTHTISAPSKIVNRLTSTPNPCSMSGTYTSFPFYDHDFVEWDTCNVVQTDSIEIQIQIRFIIEKPDTGRNYWRAKVELDNPFESDCTGVGAWMWWDAAYNPSSPCTPGTWTYNSTLSKPPAVGDNYRLASAGERYKVTAFTLGTFTLT
jgi:hypothetical protein